MLCHFLSIRLIIFTNILELHSNIIFKICSVVFKISSLPPYFNYFRKWSKHMFFIKIGKNIHPLKKHTNVTKHERVIQNSKKVLSIILSQKFNNLQLV